ncbi:MAG: cytochrome c peroxidase [Gammaproteobacteria bacterium]|nr:cytochrome c peroxidase [Gammaproteobacteria bacterium]
MILNSRFNALTLLITFCLPVFCFAGDRQWTKYELSILQSLSLSALPSLPDSASNRFADLPQAKSFGEKLFFDERLSGNGDTSCATCHQPDKYFTDGLPHINSKNTAGRNTPTIVGSGWLRWFYWDGRRDSLWAQALIPFEAKDEMGSSRLAVVRIVTQDENYRDMYESIFGEFPKNFLSSDLPKHAGPFGDMKTQDNWYRLPILTQKKINRVYSNLGKVIEAYERTLAPKPSRFDNYVDQLFDKNNQVIEPTKDEIEGIKLFIDPEKTQCMQCHNGALLTNGGFHNVGSGRFEGGKLDFGRVFGLQAVLMDEFNCLGAYSDAKPDSCTALRFLNRTNHIPLHGAYKTPSLRNVELTGPYFHDGRFNTLKEVVEFYNHPPTDNGAHELKPLNLQSEQLDHLVAFLNMLSVK